LDPETGNVVQAGDPPEGSKGALRGRGRVIAVDRRGSAASVVVGGPARAAHLPPGTRVRRRPGGRAGRPGGPGPHPALTVRPPPPRAPRRHWRGPGAKRRLFRRPRRPARPGVDV